MVKSRVLQKSSRYTLLPRPHRGNLREPIAREGDLLQLREGADSFRKVAQKVVVKVDFFEGNQQFDAVQRFNSVVLHLQSD